MAEFRELIVQNARATEGMTGPQPWAQEAGWTIGTDDHPAWCALWYSAILRRSRLVTPDWLMGQSVLTDTLPRIMHVRYRAEPGDLGYVRAWGHHAMVLEDDGEHVWSADGNGPGGVVVVGRKRPRADYAALYSIASLIEAAPEGDM